MEQYSTRSLLKKSFFFPHTTTFQYFEKRLGAIRKANKNHCFPMTLLTAIKSGQNNFINKKVDQIGH